MAALFGPWLLCALGVVPLAVVTVRIGRGPFSRGYCAHWAWFIGVCRLNTAGEHDVIIFRRPTR